MTKDIWTYDQTEQLLKLYISQEWQAKFKSGKKSHIVTWNKLAVELSLRPEATGSEAKNRFNNIKKRYMAVKKEQTSGAEPPTYEYWKTLHEFFSTRPAQEPIARINSIEENPVDNDDAEQPRQDNQEETDQGQAPATNAKKS